MIFIFLHKLTKFFHSLPRNIQNLLNEFFLLPPPPSEFLFPKYLIIEWKAFLLSTVADKYRNTHQSSHNLCGISQECFLLLLLSSFLSSLGYVVYFECWLFSHRSSHKYKYKLMESYLPSQTYLHEVIEYLRSAKAYLNGFGDLAWFIDKISAEILRRGWLTNWQKTKTCVGLFFYSFNI